MPVLRDEAGRAFVFLQDIPLKRLLRSEPTFPVSYGGAPATIVVASGGATCKSAAPAAGGQSYRCPFTGDESRVTVRSADPALSEAWGGFRPVDPWWDMVTLEDVFGATADEIVAENDRAGSYFSSARDGAEAPARERSARQTAPSLHIDCVTPHLALF